MKTLNDFTNLLSRQYNNGGKIISRPLGLALQEFLVEHKIEQKSPLTVRFYHQFITPFVNFMGEKKTIKNLISLQVKAFFETLDHSHIYSYSSYYRALRAFFNWCIRERYIETSPLTFHAPKLPEMTMPMFSKDEIIEMVKACSKKTYLRDKAIIFMLFDTGMRLCELSVLRLGDIDLENRTVHIMGKGRKERTLHLSTQTIKAIWRYLKNAKREDHGECLWLKQNGTPMPYSRFENMITETCERAGIVSHKTSPHVFRHTFANNFLDHGGDVLDLQYLLGHSSLRMVERYTRAHKAARALKAQERFSPVDHLGIK